MSRKENYIWLWRQTLDSDVFKNAGTFQLFAAILLRCTKNASTRTLRISDLESVSVELLAGEDAFTIRALSRFLCVSPNTLQARLERLEQLGCLTSRRTPKYVVVSVVNWQAYQCEGVSKPERASGEGVSEGASTVDIPSEKYNLLPYKKSTRTRAHSQTSADTEHSGFNEWWQAYPRKSAKGAALKAYRSAIKIIPPDELLAITKTFAASDKGRAGTYCPYPATWLNAQRWTDDPATWADTPPAKPSTAQAAPRTLTIAEQRKVLGYDD